MNITERLEKVDKSWHVGTISMEIMEIMREHPELTFLDIEDELRKFSKTTYLVAWPQRLMPEGTMPRGLLNPKKTFDYGLWLCINGPDDLYKTLQKFNLTNEQNRQALKSNTGFGCILVELNNGHIRG